MQPVGACNAPSSAQSPRLIPFLLDLGANEIERSALPCTPKLHGCLLGREPAHVAMPEGERRNLSPTQTSGEHCTGDDRAGVGQREAAVDREVKVAGCMAHRHDSGGFEKPRFECRDAVSGDDRDPHDPRETAQLRAQSRSMQTNVFAAERTRCASRMLGAATIFTKVPSPRLALI
jgi:hypothetical protein